MYDHTFSKSDEANFSALESFPLAFRLTVCVLYGLQGLPLAGEEEQNVGVAKGEANGVC